MPMSRKTGQRAGGTGVLEFPPVELPALRKIGDTVKCPRGARREQPSRSLARQMLHQAQAQAQRRPAIGPPFEGAIPVAARDIDGSYLHSMGTRVAHQLRRRIEAHRLAVDERRAKCRGLMGFQPRRGVREQRKARRVRLREAVVAETSYLIEYLTRETLRIIPLTHAIDQFALA